MRITENKIYNGDIVAGSLLLAESRKIAQLLLKNVNKVQWHKAIVIDNILQKRSSAAAIRQARLIKNRLVLMDKNLWQLVYDGSSEVSTQALLAASIKHSHLVGDFMDIVLRQHWQTFSEKINEMGWKRFLESCAQIDPKVDTWKESTKAKLKQVLFRILAEAKYIDSTRNLKLLPVSIAPEVKKYLVKKKEDYVIRCMEIT
ncbi:MAG: DUF1819 family protein [Deltaproteobacteria bacterium]|jgi:hypothetical protein|nr:DUF1819 family protein [Deltaproteobacteria bacterium]